MHHNMRYALPFMILACVFLVAPVNSAQNEPLQIWSRFNTDNPQVTSDQWLTRLLQDYQADSGLEVQNTFYPFDQINTTLNIAVQTRTNVPDVAYMDTEQISFFYNNGTLTDLTDFVTNAAWFDDLDPTALATCIGPDDRFYCVPSTTSHYYLYYWTELFPDGYPTTTVDFLQIAPTIRESGYYPITFKAADGVSVERFYTGLMLSYGAELAGANGEATWASNEAIEAVQFVRDIFAADYVPPVALAPQFEYEEPFKQGQAVSFVAGTFSYVYLSPLTAPNGVAYNVEITGAFDSNALAVGAAVADDAIEFAPPLAAPNSVPVSMISGEGWAIPVGTENIEAGLAFIDYQMTTTRNIEAAIAGGKLPVLVSSAQDEAFSTPYWIAAQEIRANYGAVAPGWIDYNNAQRLLSEAIVEVITSPSADIREELQRAQDEYNLLIR
jgi:ABC-type glycerol-3-phosphate transport system substrate-binding protein